MLLEEVPALSVPLVAKLSCARCGRRAAEAGVEKLRRCVACKQARYCSEGCQSRDWALHGLECGVLAGVREHGRTLEAELRAVVRVACMVVRAEQGAAAMSAFVRGSPVGGDAAGAVGRLLALVHNRERLSPDDEARAGQGLARLHAATAGTALARALGDALPEAAGAGSEARPAQSVLTVLGAAAVLRLLGLVRCNGFTAYDSSLEPCTLAVYPRAARVNHSCDPTAVASFLPSADGPRLSLRACTRVDAGGPVTISYDDPATPRARRRSRLSRAYFFSCGCERCSAAGEGAPWQSLSLAAHATLAEMSGFAAASGASSLLGPLPRACAARDPASNERRMLWVAEVAASGVRCGQALHVPRLGEEGDLRQGGAAAAPFSPGSRATAAAGGSAALQAPTDGSGPDRAAGEAAAAAANEASAGLELAAACTGTGTELRAEEASASSGGSDGLTQLRLDQAVAAAERLRAAVDDAEAREPRVRSAGRAAHEAAALEAAVAETADALSPAHFDRRRALTLLARLRLKAGSTDGACDAALAALALARLQYTRPCAPLAIAATFASRVAWACERPELAARLIQMHRSTLEVALGPDHPVVREALLTLAECAAEIRAKEDA